MRRWLGWLAALGVAVAGCGAGGGGVRAPGAGAAGVALRPGMTLQVGPAVAGPGARALLLAGRDRGVKVVTVAELDGASLLLTWRETRQELTPDSRQEQEAWERQQAALQVGETLPPRPAPRHQPVEVTGALRVAAPGAGTRPAAVLAPGLWPAGTEVARPDHGAIWLSRHAFRELVDRRRTAWNHGAFEGLVLGALGAVDGALRQAFQGMAGRLDPDRRAALDYLEADQQLRGFQLTVNGRDTSVPAVHAHNWFVDLYILNDPDNPLILQATFNPISDGPLDVFSPLGVLKALLGFRVLAVQTD